MNDQYSNFEIVTLAVYLLNGESNYTDTEDVAVKANEIAPQRFAWRKYPDQINIENVRTFLSDAKKEKNGSYLIGSGKEGWLLTEKGLTFAKKMIEDFEGVDPRKRQSAKDKQREKMDRARMLSEPAFCKYKSGEIDAITNQEAASFFRIDDYVVGKTRERKILRYLNTFGDDQELGLIVRILADRIKEI